MSTESKPARLRKPAGETLLVIAIDRGTNCGFIYGKTTSVKAAEKVVLVLDGQQREKLIEYMRRLAQADYLKGEEKKRITQLYIPTLEAGQIPTSLGAKSAMRSLGCGPWKIPLEIAGYNDQMFTLSTMRTRRNGNVSLTPRGKNSQTPARKLK